MKISNLSYVNFVLGMVLGVFAVLFHHQSIYLYFFVFCPSTLTLFILINYNDKKPKRDDEE